MGLEKLLDLCTLKLTFILTGKSAEEVSRQCSASLRCFRFTLRGSVTNPYIVLHGLTNNTQIRQILNLPKMTPEEEAKARIEHPWIFEENNNNSNNN